MKNDPNISQLDRDIYTAEEELLVLRERIAKLKQQVPRDEVSDYELTTTDGGKITLSKMFGDKNDLILIHNMGKGCRYCTLWADGFTGFVPHLTNRSAFVVTSPDKPEVVKEFSSSRNWNFPIYSAYGTTLFKDMGFESEKGDPWPGVTTFHRDEEGRIYRVSKASFGPGDDFCSIFHLFDLLDDGINGWEPQYSYE